MINLYYFFDFIFSYINYIIFYLIFFYIYKKNEKSIIEEKFERENNFIFLEKDFLNCKENNKKNLNHLAEEKKKVENFYENLLFFEIKFLEEKNKNLLREDEIKYLLKKAENEKLKFSLKNKNLNDFKKGFLKSFKDQCKNFDDFFIFNKNKEKADL